jgi:putative oxidoreductase
MNLGLLVLRLVVGLLFVGHGAQKLFGSFGGHGPEGTGAFFESVGMRPGRTMALAAGSIELIGGLLFAAGLVTPLGAALISITMFTAIWTVHSGNGLWAPEGGYEYNLVLLAAAFAVSAIGAGAWSLDHALELDVAGAGWALGELAAGVAGSAIAVATGGAAARRSFRRPRAAHPASGP